MEYARVVEISLRNFCCLLLCSGSGSEKNKLENALLLH